MSKHRKLGRVCPCGVGICDVSTTGLCKPCFMRKTNADPELRKRRGETTSRKLRENPDLYARKCAILAKNRAGRDPEQLRQSGFRLAHYRTPETETKRIAGLIAANKRRRHPWLPDCYREDYRKMLRNKRIRSPEAKRIILAQVAADRAKEIAQLSPFERQDRALRMGAKLVANDQRPSLANPGFVRHERMVR